MDRTKIRKVQFALPDSIMPFRIASSIPSNSLPHMSSTVKSNRPATRSSLSVSGRNVLLSSLNKSNKSVDFSSVENEYIRNLQQQIYFLELECEYLREQANKVVSIPTDLSKEAEKMVRKIKHLQNELRERDQDLLKRNSLISTLQIDRDNTDSKLNLCEESFAAEKRELINEIVSLKKHLERKELDHARKVNENQKIKEDFDTTFVGLKESSNRLNVTQAQLHEKNEEYNKLRIMYEEKRAESLRIQTEFKELEDRFFNSKAKPMENVNRSLKDEMKTLRYEVREKEMQAEQERTLRLKIADDCAALVKENAALSSQCSEFQKLLDMERDFKNDKSFRQQANIQELVTLKEERKHLERELERAQDVINIEREKYRRLLDKFSDEEQHHTRAKLHSTKLRAELEELEGIESVESNENVTLRRDKLLLSDEVAELQSKLREKDDQVETLRIKLSDLQIVYSDLDNKHRTTSNLESIKWEEFERMAEQMKQFSRTMSPVRNSISNTSLKSRTLDFES